MLSRVAEAACVAVARKLGISKTAVVELALRDYASKNGVEAEAPAEVAT